jgi:uncharacterized membrane protein YeaQ/YmgE (transglycosylase-associated protein family)
MIGAIIIGLTAGWLAGKLMRGQGYGFFGDIVLGLVGAVIGGWLFARLGVPVYGSLSMLAMATVGAIILVTLAHLVRGDYHA